MPSSLTAAERSLRASIAPNSRWAATPAADRRRQAERGQAALLAKFADQVDPEGALPEAERTKLAGNAYAAHMKRLALASSRARRKGASANEAA
jgi:hypothetical protein